MRGHTSLHMLIQPLPANISAICAAVILEFCVHIHHYEFISIIHQPVDTTLQVWCWRRSNFPLSALIKPAHKTTDCCSCYVSLTSTLPTSMWPKQKQGLFFMSHSCYKIHSIPHEEWKLGRSVTTAAKTGRGVCSRYGQLRATRWNDSLLETKLNWPWT